MMDMADLIVRTDGLLVVLMIGLGVYMTREVIEAFLGVDHDPQRCRPLQLLALFTAMIWSHGLGRLLALIRRSAIAAGDDSFWLIDRGLRLALNLIPSAVGLGLLLWLMMPRWTCRSTVALCGVVGAGALLFAWPAPIQALSYELYSILEWLSGR